MHGIIIPKVKPVSAVVNEKLHCFTNNPLPLKNSRSFSSMICRTGIFSSPASRTMYSECFDVLTSINDNLWLPVCDKYINHFFGFKSMISASSCTDLSDSTVLLIRNFTVRKYLYHVWQLYAKTSFILNTWLCQWKSGPLIQVLHTFYTYVQ